MRAALLLGCLLGLVLPGSPSRGAEEKGHSHAPRPIPKVSPREVLLAHATDRMAAGLVEVKLRGTLDVPPGRERPQVLETGLWPDRFRREVTTKGQPASWMRLSPTVFVRGIGTKEEPGSPEDRDLAISRLRSLFVVRHFFEALRGGAVPKEIPFAGQTLPSVEVKDAYGTFRIAFGGLTGKLQGLEVPGRNGGVNRTFFLASARLGRWFYPAVQSTESPAGLEVLRVVATTTLPEGE
ncbi:MAG: hypothetical protein JNK60_13455 [Acidobacteria bacterium]|nr:hypothetical protein [Acidobacteriota bacterium]